MANLDRDGVLKRARDIDAARTALADACNHLGTELDAAAAEGDMTLDPDGQVAERLSLAEAALDRIPCVAGRPSRHPTKRRLRLWFTTEVAGPGRQVFNRRLLIAAASEDQALEMAKQCALEWVRPDQAGPGRFLAESFALPTEPSVVLDMSYGV